MKPDMQKIAEWAGYEKKCWTPVFGETNSACHFRRLSDSTEIVISNFTNSLGHIINEYDPLTNDAQNRELEAKAAYEYEIRINYMANGNWLVELVSFSTNEGVFTGRGQTLNEAIVNAVWAMIQEEG